MTINTRRRKKLVEGKGVEVFEIRLTLWFDEDGRPYASMDITDPDGPATPMLHEILGVLEMGMDISREHFQ